MTGSGVLLLIRQILVAIHGNVGIRGPTRSQREEEDFERSAIMRRFPDLKNRLAFRLLGDNFPTPVHRGECSHNGHECNFYVKREDLCSSNRYGGNKVRTLQHQLGVVEARVETENVKNLIVIGSAGSNQIVASVVYTNSLKSKPSVSASWMAKDPENLDNAMNMLSSLSFSSLRADISNTWANPIKMLRQVIGALWSKSSSTVILPMGGNSPAGVLGQISACLELAEQIEKGELKDPPAIYLAVGSSCTVSGLVIGIALARRLNMNAFSSTKIVGVPIHHAIGMSFLSFLFKSLSLHQQHPPYTYTATLQRSIGFLKSKMFGWIPLTTRHTVATTCDVLEKLLPNSIEIRALKEDALQVMEHELEFKAEKSMIGTYGGHSKLSKTFSEMYDRTGKIFDSSGNRAEHIWLCGHFTSKAFAVMIQDIERAKLSGKHDYCPLFWQTKSAIQPRGDVDEFDLAKKVLPSKVHRWLNRSKQDSTLRPGRIDMNSKVATSYRNLMTRSML